MWHISFDIYEVGLEVEPLKSNVIWNFRVQLTNESWTNIRELSVYSSFTNVSKKVTSAQTCIQTSSDLCWWEYIFPIIPGNKLNSVQFQIGNQFWVSNFGKRNFRAFHPTFGHVGLKYFIGGSLLPLIFIKINNVKGCDNNSYLYKEPSLKCIQFEMEKLSITSGFS